MDTSTIKRSRVSILGAGLIAALGAGLGSISNAVSLRDAFKPARASGRDYFASTGRSKYTPHQGPRECARRRRQKAVDIPDLWF